MTDEWITTGEAAALTGYHPEYVRELIREGRIKARKFARDWMVSKRSLLTYARSGAESPDKRRGSRRNSPEGTRTDVPS